MKGCSTGKVNQSPNTKESNVSCNTHPNKRLTIALGLIQEDCEREEVGFKLLEREKNLAAVEIDNVVTFVCVCDNFSRLNPYWTGYPLKGFQKKYGAKVLILLAGEAALGGVRTNKPYRNQDKTPYKRMAYVQTILTRYQVYEGCYNEFLTAYTNRNWELAVRGKKLKHLVDLTVGT